MAEYLARYEIDVDGESPLEAAQEAYAAMVDPVALPPTLDVYPREAQGVDCTQGVRIDLNNEPPTVLPIPPDPVKQLRPDQTALVEHVISNLGSEVRPRQRCVGCEQEALERCRQEHPDWFTPKRREPRSRYFLQVESFVAAHVPQRPCLLVYDYGERFFSEPTDRCAVCAEHLQLVVDYLRDPHAES